MDRLRNLINSLIKLNTISRVDRMPVSVNLLVKKHRNRVQSTGIHPTNPNDIFVPVQICSCPNSRIEEIDKMTSRIQKSFKELTKTLEERYGTL